VIKDLSKNGTYINGKAISNKARSLIKLNDVINFSINGSSYIVKDLSPPCDMLIPIDNSVATEAIKLKTYNLLLNDNELEIAIIYNALAESWYVEHINQEHENTVFLQDHAQITVNNVIYQLQLSRIVSDTQTLFNTKCNLNDLSFIFYLSLDEEITHLQLQSPVGSIDMTTRVHHYLTLSLARYKVEDMHNDVKEELQGWVNTTKLCKDLGLDLTHLNIQIHRVRKQFTDMLYDYIGATELIERRKGEVRFTGQAFEIYKGKKLELSSITNAYEH
jgi:hypothetical protein